MMVCKREKRQIPEGFYVYAYYERGDALPFWIGKGKGHRAWAHLEERVLSLLRSPFYSKIKSLLSRGELPEIVIKEDNLLESEAFAYEEQLIREIGRKDLGSRSSS